MVLLGILLVSLALGVWSEENTSQTVTLAGAGGNGGMAAGSGGNGGNGGAGGNGGNGGLGADNSLLGYTYHYYTPPDDPVLGTWKITSVFDNGNWTEPDPRSNIFVYTFTYDQAYYNDIKVSITNWWDTSADPYLMLTTTFDYFSAVVDGQEYSMYKHYVALDMPQVNNLFFVNGVLYATDISEIGQGNPTHYAYYKLTKIA